MCQLVSHSCQLYDYTNWGQVNVSTGFAFLPIVWLHYLGPGQMCQLVLHSCQLYDYTNWGQGKCVNWFCIPANCMITLTGARANVSTGFAFLSIVWLHYLGPGQMCQLVSHSCQLYDYTNWGQGKCVNWFRIPANCMITLSGARANVSTGFAFPPIVWLH
jgi:hypothetical protein